MTMLLLLVTAAISLTALAGLIRVRRIPVLVIPWFIFGWLGAEMPLWVASFQILIIICQLLLSNLDTITAQLIMAAALWNCVALIHCQKKHQQSADKLIGDFKQSTNLTTEPFRKGETWQKPFDFKRPGVECIQNIQYGSDKLQALDIYRPKSPTKPDMPVLLQIHGGAWIIGDKREQALPLLYSMAERGWTCISCNYRLGAKDRWPSMIDDVESCINWIKTHAKDYRLDPDFICVTGGSAGGHLSAMAALRNPDIKAAVPLYGIYDFLDSQKIRGPVSMQKFLEKSVMPCPANHDTELWKQASPIFITENCRQDFLVLHGSHDSLAMEEEARAFTEKLKHNTNDHQVVYLKVDHAQHAFDLIWSERTRATVEVISAWLNSKYESYLQKPVSQLKE